MARPIRQRVDLAGAACNGFAGREGLQAGAETAISMREKATLSRLDCSKLKSSYRQLIRTNNLNLFCGIAGASRILTATQF